MIASGRSPVSATAPTAAATAKAAESAARRMRLGEWRSIRFPIGRTRRSPGRLARTSMMPILMPADDSPALTIHHASAIWYMRVPAWLRHWPSQTRSRFRFPSRKAVVDRGISGRPPVDDSPDLPGAGAPLDRSRPRERDLEDELLRADPVLELGQTRV